MTRFRFISSVFIGTLFYVLLSITFGREGFYVTRQLQKQKELLVQNTEKIQNITENLQLEKIAMESDKDLIASYARKLGLIRPGEKLVKINGLSIHESQIYDAGTVLHCQKVSYVPEWICKVTGLIAFVVSYVLFILYDIKTGYIDLPRKKQYESMVKGTQIYDMQ